VPTPARKKAGNSIEESTLEELSAPAVFVLSSSKEFFEDLVN
jgi:hypothetical protein